MSESPESSSPSSGVVTPELPRKKLPPKKATPTLKKTVPQSDSKKSELAGKSPTVVPKAAVSEEPGKSSMAKNSPKLVTKLSGGSVPKKDGKGLVPLVPKKKIPAGRPSVDSSGWTSLLIRPCEPRSFLSATNSQNPPLTL